MLMPIGQLFDAAIKTFQARGKDMAIAVLAVLAPIAAIRFVWLAALGGSVPGVVGQVFLGLLSWIGSLLATAACLRIVAAYGEGRNVTWRESLDEVSTRLGDLIVLSLLAGLAVVLGVIACILPGIWLAILFVFAVPVLLTEPLKSTDAMRRSADLVKGRWWAIFGRLFLGFILVGIATAIVALIVAIPFYAILGSSGTGGDFAATVANLVGSVLATPFQAALITILFFEVRRLQGAAPAGAVVPDAPAAPAPSTSVPPPGGAWDAPPAPPAPAAPPIPPPPAQAAPPTPPPAPPAAPAPPAPPADAGTSASTGSLWSSGDPLAAPEPPAPEQQWEPPAPQPPADGGESAPPPSTPPPA